MKFRLILSLLTIGFYNAFAQSETQFRLLKNTETGVTFKNQLDENPKSNVLTYEYFYNGGGVAVGDINNDGLEDIYFSANMRPNELYLNLGNMKFQNITSSAGVQCEAGWKTGVNMIDINGDGFLDVYVCFSGKGDPEKRRNKLFINNGNLTFTERAKEYGLDDPSHSTHAAFFDYDRDGDLDMYLLNHNITVIREVEFEEAKKTRHPYAGDKLFRNDDGRFNDVSESAGIKGNPLGFGLGISVTDINKDGWPDIYVSNDYIEADYVYINNKDGTFTDRMTEYMQHISYFSMGVDVSDFNNDGWADIFTLDMLPEDNKRQKLLYGPENYEHFALMVMNGFYFQNMRNMLHMNNRNGTYSEIGQLAGVSKTDWSWSPLFADYDNDGLKDLFITNGYYRDYTNRDFLKYKGDYYFEKARLKEKADTFHLVTSMSSTPVHNYIYKNNGDLTFTDKSAAWGFGELNFSNGASFADLDNDGDLDLIVNNQNAFASIYRNESHEKHPDAHYLAIKLIGNGKNTDAVGAKVSVYTKGGLQYQEQIITRGFQSCVTRRLHFGLRDNSVVDSIVVVWPDGSARKVENIKADQIISISIESTRPAVVAEIYEPQKFTKTQPIVNYAHTESGYNDFKRQPLLLSMLTNCGPVFATADVNKDGLIDVFVGGTQNNPGKIYLQQQGAVFVESTSAQFEKIYTDADAYFFDADNDLDVDLYVVSGGYNDYDAKDKALQDRLYLNDGSGKFSRAASNLPTMLVSKSCIAGSDFDHDGDVDLFIGGRVIPGQYPVTPESFLLRNTNGKFENIAVTEVPELAQAGMITDAKWMDLNNDSWDDLLVIGEFIPVRIFLNEKGKLRESSKQFFDEPLNGLWNRMAAYDFDKDGDQDIILGNFGLNSQLTASKTEPLNLVVRDFDKNGSVDPILCYYNQGKSYPFPSRDELLDQMYSMRSKFTSYESYSEVQLKNIFSPADLKGATTLTANILASVYLENASGKFKVHALPVEAQFAPVNAIATLDYNKDGNMDFVIAGNQSAIRIRMGVIDANFGQLFEGDGKGHFKYIPQDVSGLRLTGDIKALQPITISRRLFLLIGVNNGGVESYILN